MNRWSIEIDANKNVLKFNLIELIRYKDLLYFLVLRGIKAKYAQSILGVSWAIIQPLITTLVFTIIFGNLAKIDSDGIPYALFSFLGVLPWTYFSSTLTESTNSLVQNANMISKVYFPRLVLPLAAIFTKLLDFLIGFVVLAYFLFHYGIVPGINVLIVPLLIFILIASSLGIGLFLSSLSIQFRDIKYAMGFMVQIFMYAAPVVYSTSAVPDDYLFYYALNPMVGVIEGFRAAFIGTEIPWQFIMMSLGTSIFLLILGLFSFLRMERFFADVA